MSASIAIVLDSTIPLGEQIEFGVRQAIAAGELKPGDLLPPVRQLAADLGVNLNTVARAYRALERRGLVLSRRGRGTRVSNQDESASMSRAEAESNVAAKLREALTDARLAGLERPEVESLFRAQLNSFWGTGDSPKGAET